MPAPFGERLGAVAHHLPAGEQVRDERVALEPLERDVRIEQRIAVVEPGDEAHRETPRRQRVDEPAPELLDAERMAHRMDHRSGGQTPRVDVPQLLDADGVALGRPACVEIEAADQRLGEIAPYAVGQHRHPGANVDPRFERRLAFSVPVDAAVAGAHPDDPVPLVEQLRAGEPGEHVDAGRLDLPAEPLHEAIERDDVVTVVPQRRGREGKRQRAAGGQEIDAVIAHRHVERRAAVLPVRHQLGQNRRIEHRPREHVGAGRPGLLQDGHHQRLAAPLLVQPCETIRGGESGRPAPDDEHVDVERLALHVSFPRAPPRSPAPPRTGRRRCRSRPPRRWARPRPC